jgi:hypothetical protein
MASALTEQIIRLRAETGAPLLDCQLALREAEGDMALAAGMLRWRNSKYWGPDSLENRMAQYGFGPRWQRKAPRGEASNRDQADEQSGAAGG